MQGGLYMNRSSDALCRSDVLGLHYVVSDIDRAVRYTLTHFSELSGEYICFSNVHTTIMAVEDKSFARIQNAAALLFADGEPIASCERKNGYPDAKRVAGPDFMAAMFGNRQTHPDGRPFTHYFYGSSPKTLRGLKRHLVQTYPGIHIAGMYSPPFRTLTPEEENRDIERIRKSGADFIWIGLGAPKQERWMHAHKGVFNGVMLGVGAGFDFHSGTVKRAPRWMQRLSLEWLYRLSQDPVRLFPRYLKTNSRFLYLTRIKPLFSNRFSNKKRAS